MAAIENKVISNSLRPRIGATEHKPSAVRNKLCPIALAIRNFIFYCCENEGINRLVSRYITIRISVHYHQGKPKLAKMRSS
jgi:hypothetical protein